MDSDSSAGTTVKGNVGGGSERGGAGEWKQFVGKMGWS